LKAAQREITVAGVRLRYLDLQPSAPATASPILLLHGLLATAETLGELIRCLPPGRRIVALDLLSAVPGGVEALDLRSEALANLVLRFTDSVGLDRAVVLGHSYGGTLALRLAATRPDQVQALVLLCPAHPFEGYRSHVVAFYLTRWGRFLALSIPLAPRWMILRAFNQAAGAGRAITLTHLKPYLPVLRNRDSLRRVLEMLHTWEDDMEELRQTLLRSPILQPALLIWGDEDTVVPPASAAALQQRLVNSECVSLPGKGHLLAEEAPEECGRAVTAWLNRLPRRRPVG
jgi:pimeloyl-ACP methyl ester carboxylesterase